MFLVLEPVTQITGLWFRHAHQRGHWLQLVDQGAVRPSAGRCESKPHGAVVRLRLFRGVSIKLASGDLAFHCCVNGCAWAAA